MSKLAIQIENLYKVFRIYPDLVQSRVKQGLFFWKKYYKEKTALENINLTVEKGEVIGVIGPNGAGKTTLLKMIAGISQPTSGSIRCSSRVVAVLALGLGFHPRLTGMENITLSGMMLGMTKKQIRDRIDWIIDFSELGEYIERPMTTYSMGMQARLSFAVAACQEPDILIIDEALATGDIRFVQKCIKRIHEIVQSGTTALFVSHNIWSIKKLTQRCILIDRGKVADDGPTWQVTERFYEVMLKNEVLESGERVATVNNFVGSGEVRLLNIRLLQDRNVETDTLLSGKETFFELEIESSEKREIGTSLECWRLDGISAFSTGISGGSLDTKGNFVNRVLEVPKGKSKLVVQFPSLYLAPGEYYLNLHIFNPNEFSGYTSNEQFYFKTHIKEFRVSKLQNPNHLMVYYQPFETWVEK